MKILYFKNCQWSILIDLLNANYEIYTELYTLFTEKKRHVIWRATKIILIESTILIDLLSANYEIYTDL